MNDIDLEVFFSGGYFLIGANHPGWQQLQSDLIPAKLISLSDCICPKFNVNWGWATGDTQLALDFGITKEKLDEFVDWCREDYKQIMDIWSMFYTPQDARQFINRFMLDTDNLHIIGVGLPQSLEKAGWQESRDDIYGIEKRIEQHIALQAGGKTLGYEIVSFEYGSFGHSWLCHYLHEDAHRLFGIRPNQYGLFESYQNARTVLDWINAGGDEGRAHHPPYDVWQLTTYS